ncbi:MAG TPA: class I SAM-dependent methyltransferase [Terriglobales bacterium]|nr:class I SAM-dependent methyltransferase [Terriglobales bacterium]
MAKALKRFARRNGFLYVLYNIPRLLKGYYPIFLDYAVRPVPRYGYGKPPHPQLYELFSRERQRYRQTLQSFLTLEPFLVRIPLRAEKNSADPCWINNWLDGLDTLALYSLVAQRKPARYMEVGSGYSTKVVRRALRDHGLSTRVISIDPRPRAEIDALCDEVIRHGMEDVALARFDELGPGDILFVDGSHRSFMNSDATVFFLDVLPRLKPGVLAHIHDIDLPYDYMPERAEWYYSEQYLLAASLLAGHQNYSIVLPNAFISKEPDVMEALQPFWSRSELKGVPPKGVSFWLETRGKTE